MDHIQYFNSAFYAPTCKGINDQSNTTNKAVMVKLDNLGEACGIFKEVTRITTS